MTHAPIRISDFKFEISFSLGCLKNARRAGYSTGARYRLSFHETPRPILLAKIE